VSIKTDTHQITPEILGLIAEIDEFKSTWRALGTIAPERLLALRGVATIQSRLTRPVNRSAEISSPR
jgi:hypothetical protein